MLQLVQPSQKLCHRHVKFGGNVLIQVHLHEQGKQLRGLVDIDPRLLGALDDGLR